MGLMLDWARTAGDRAFEQLLVEQVTGSVRWRESVMWMAANGVTGIWEIGAGKALSGMIRRIAKEVTCRAVGTPEDIAALIAFLLSPDAGFIAGSLIYADGAHDALFRPDRGP